MNAAYLETADRIAARLCRDALWSCGRCNWTSDSLVSGEIIHTVLGPSLYAGTSGIALFLHRMARASGEPIFRATAAGALRLAMEKLPLKQCGLYSGALGIYYAAAEMNHDIDEEAVIRHGAPDRSELDVISGSAGAIAALLHLGRITGSARLLELAVQHGDLLLSAAAKQLEGWSWQTIPASRNLTGFSHGAAGIAWSLIELYAAAKEDRFRSAAKAAIRYERTHWNPEKQNWPDFRGTDTAYPVFWCHGAAGIALSRLRGWQILGDAELRTEAITALGTVALSAGSLSNYSLCHGESGNGDVLMHAAEVLEDDAWLLPAETVAEAGLDQYERRRVPWPCGLSGANETPDLMLGLAGIGHFYLRLADPKQTPGVLLPAC